MKVDDRRDVHRESGRRGYWIAGNGFDFIVKGLIFLIPERERERERGAQIFRGIQFLLA